jgi:hypothetical protein
MPLYLPRTSFASGQALEVWGCVRPARFARLATGRTQRVRLQFQSGGRGSFVTLATIPLRDPHGYFDVAHSFPRAGVVRLAWSYPHGPQIYSRAVTVTTH